MLAPGGEVDADTAIARGLIAARKLYPEFVRELREESRLPIDFQTNGGLDLAYSEDDVARLEKRRVVHEALALESKWLGANEIATFWPRVRRKQLMRGLFYRGDAIVDPRDVTAALALSSRARGVEFAPNTAVEEIVGDGAGVRVRAGGTQSLFDAAVIAAGAWSSSIHVTPPLPEVTPVKGVLLGYRQPEQTCTTIVRHRHTYVLQRANGTLIVGASVERSGFDRRIDSSVAGGLAVQAAIVFPHLGETTPSEIWSGLRPYAESPRTGKWGNAPIYLAYGHYRNGILMAALPFSL